MIAKFKRMLVYFGPAYIVSIGYMDPGNWSTDIAAGSFFGYKLLWILLVSNLVALLVQSLALRLGIVSRKDLAEISSELYPKPVVNVLFVFAMIAIIATDMAEVIGVSIGIHLIFGLPIYASAIIGAFSTLLVLALFQDRMRIIELILVSLVVVIASSFIVQIFIFKPVFSDLIVGFIPTKLNTSEIFVSLGILGAVVMPHNIYLHSFLVKDKGKTGDLKEVLKANFIDTILALNLAFLVNSAILIVAAAALYSKIQISGLSDAYNILFNFGGNVAAVAFGIALIASGQSSTITGTLSATVISSGYLKLKKSVLKQRTITRLIALIPVVYISLRAPDTIEDLMIVSQVVLSLQLGFVVIPLIQMVSSKPIMEGFRIKNITLVVSWAIAIGLLVLNMKFLVDYLVEIPKVLGVILGIIMVAFIVFFLYVFSYPYYGKEWKDRTNNKI